MELRNRDDAGKDARTFGGSIGVDRGSGLGCVTTGGFNPGGPTTVWAKQGTTRAQRRAEWEDCLFSAAKEIPAAMATAFSPGVSTPGTVMCNNYGGAVSCRHVGGVNIPASARTVDQNAGLRKRYAEVCMEKKGFAQVPGKFCARSDDLTSEDCIVATP